MIRRVGSPPEAGRRYTVRPGAYAILPLKKRVLLTGQDADVLDIQLPGGGIDPGESQIQALHREVREEIGWCISNPRRLGAFRTFIFIPEYDLWAEKLCHVYVARPVYQVTQPTEADHFTLVLDPIEAAAAVGSDGVRQFIQSYFKLP